MTPAWTLDETKYLRPDEDRRLFDAVELAARRDREKGRTTWPRRLALLTLMRGAGLRVSEVAALRVDDLDLHAERARVLVREGKYRKVEKGKRAPKPDVAPLAAEAVPHVLAYLADKENWGESTDAGVVLFPSGPLEVRQRVQPLGAKLDKVGNAPPAGHIQKRTIQYGFKKALALAGLPLHYSPHCLRHTYGVQLYRKTHDLRLVQIAMRHRRSSTTEIYAGVLPEDLHAGVNGTFTETERPAWIDSTFTNPEKVDRAMQAADGKAAADGLDQILKAAGVDTLAELADVVKRKTATPKTKRRKALASFPRRAEFIAWLIENQAATQAEAERAADERARLGLLGD